MKKSFEEYCAEEGLSEILAEWDIERNAPLMPKDVSFGSHKMIWWRCKIGHSWQTRLYARRAGSRCPFCSGSRTSLSDNSLLVRRPKVAAQWHPTRNGSLTPAMISFGSHRSVWWRCENGHEWRAQVKSRANGVGCPFCSNRIVEQGYNDLLTCAPNVAAQWDYEKNYPMRPEEFTFGSRASVWWNCKNGHHYKTSIYSRTRMDSDCPYCSGNKVLEGYNDLQSRFPDIAAQWDYEKNMPLQPSQLTAYANRRVWWLCEKGHSYKTLVSLRASRNTGCPYCANRMVLPGFNDLETTAPRVAAEWHPTKNGTLTPQMVTAGSNKSVWWRCSEGHEWKAIVCSRAGSSQSCGCPECAGRRKRHYEQE